MSDKNVDSILLEIDATTDKADGGISKTIRNLKSLKEVTEGIDTAKLESIRDTFKSFGVGGDGLKKAGDGMRSVSSAVRSMSNVDSSKLKEMSEAISKIGTGLGSLGSNNRINIRIDSEGIKESMQPLEQVRGVFENASVDQSVATVAQEIQAAMGSATQSAEQFAAAQDHVGASGRNAATEQQAFNDSLNQTNAATASAKIQELIIKIKEYKATISGMESGKIEFDTSAYVEAVNGLERAQEQFNQFKAAAKSTPQTMNDVARSISSIGSAAQKCGLNTFSSLLQGIAGILPSIEIGGMAANAGFQSMAVGLQAVQSAIPIIGLILTLISALVNAVNSAANKIKSAVGKSLATVKTFANKVRQSVNSIITKLKDFKKKISSALGLSDRSFSEFSKKLKALTRLGTFMLLRKAFTALFGYIGAGFNNLAQYSNMIGSEFNKSVSRIWSDAKWFGNSLATAFEPILNYVTPILDYLIEKLVAATRAIAQFFSALTGKTVYTKAIKLNENYAASLDSAAKAVNNLTTGIDELHILQENNAASGGGTAPGDSFITEEIGGSFKDLAKMFKDAWANGDFYDIGRMVGEKLKEALENIPWDNIKASLRKIAKSIATFLNGFLETPGLFTVIGKTIAEAINSAFEFVDSFVENFHWDSLGKAITDLLLGFLDNIDWPLIRKTSEGLAKGIVETINTALRNDRLWKELGNGIANAINTAILFAKTAIREFDFKAFGVAIGNLLGNALVNIDYKGIGKSFSNLVNGIFQSVINFSKTFPWVDLAKNIASGINAAISGINWSTVYDGFKSFFRGLGSNLMTFIREMDWGGLAEALVNGVTSIFVGLNSFLSALDPADIGRSIAEFVNRGFAKLRENKDQILGAINSLIHTLSEIFLTAIREIKWGEVFGTIRDYLGGIDWETIFKTAIVGIAGVFTFKKIFNLIAIMEIGSQLIAGIISGISEAIKTIGTILKQVFINPFVNVVKKLFGIHSPSTVFAEIGSYLVEGLILGVANNISRCMPILTEWASKVKDWFYGAGTTLKDRFAEFGSNIVEGFRERIGSAYTSVKGNIDAWANGVKDWFSKSGGINGNTWRTYASDIISGFKAYIGNSYTNTKSNITSWVKGIKEWFSGSDGVNEKTWQTYASDIIRGFKNKVGSTHTDSKGNMETWARNVKSWFSKIADGDSFGNIAKNVVHGFRDGIGRFYNDCKGTIESWASNVAGWFKSKLDIHSPSKLFEQFGDFTVMGFNNAIENTGKTTKGIMSEWASSFSNMNVNLGTKISIDNSALKDYQANYGSDFSNDVMIQKVQREIATQGSFQATINAENGFIEALKNIAREEIMPIMSDMAADMKRQADKDERPQVVVGRRTITDVVKTQQKADGYAFSL